MIRSDPILFNPIQTDSLILFVSILFDPILFDSILFDLILFDPMIFRSDFIRSSKCDEVENENSSFRLQLKQIVEIETKTKQVDFHLE